jgi:hypothetical protein
MQIRKADVRKIFEKLKLEARSTKHRYGWFTFEGRKILRVHITHMEEETFQEECQIKLEVN